MTAEGSADHPVVTVVVSIDGGPVTHGGILEVDVDIAARSFTIGPADLSAEGAIVPNILASEVFRSVAGEVARIAAQRARHGVVSTNVTATESVSCELLAVVDHADFVFSSFTRIDIGVGHFRSHDFSDAVTVAEDGCAKDCRLTRSRRDWRHWRHRTAAFTAEGDVVHVNVEHVGAVEVTEGHPDVLTSVSAEVNSIFIPVTLRTVAAAGSSGRSTNALGT